MRQGQTGRRRSLWAAGAALSVAVVSGVAALDLLTEEAAGGARTADVKPVLAAKPDPVPGAIPTAAMAALP